MKGIEKEEKAKERKRKRLKDCLWCVEKKEGYRILVGKNMRGREGDSESGTHTREGGVRYEFTRRTRETRALLRSCLPHTDNNSLKPIESLVFILFKEVSAWEKQNVGDHDRSSAWFFFFTLKAVVKWTHFLSIRLSLVRFPIHYAFAWLHKVETHTSALVDAFSMPCWYSHVKSVIWKWLKET